MHLILHITVLCCGLRLALAACTTGLPGYDASADVTFDGHGCVTEKYTGMPAAVTTCNGTNGHAGANGASIDVQVGVTQVCDVIHTTSSSTAICDGPTGPRGATGGQGPDGPAATPANITRSINAVTNATQWFISNATTRFEIKNMTAPQGLTGAQGPNGTQGPPGLNGTQGVPGFQGPTPGYIVVNGGVALCTGGGNSPTGYGSICPTFNTTCSCATRYALTRAGIQQAINDASNLCTGTTFGGSQIFVCTAVVLVGGNVVSDGVALQLASYVTLDFNGNTFSAVGNSSSQDLVQAIGGPLGTAQLLLATMAQFNTSAVVASTSPFTVGSVVVIQGGTINGITSGTNRLGQQTNIVTAINSATNTLTFRYPAAYDFLTSLGASIVPVTNPLVNGGIRNAIFNAGGNTGTLTRLCVVENVQNFVMNNVVVTGALAATMGPSVTLPADYTFMAAGIWVSVALDSTFKRISALSFSGGSTSVRDIALSGLAGSSIQTLRSQLSGGPGPAMMFSTFSTVRAVHVQQPTGSGFKIETTAFCQFTSIICNAARTNGTATGVGFFFGSHHNNVKSVVSVANAWSGMAFQGDADSFNVIRGFHTLNNNNQSIVFGSASAGAVGNALTGNFDAPPSSVAPKPFDRNFVEFINGANGHIVQSVSHTIPTTADFIGGRQAIIYIQDNGPNIDDQLYVAVQGADGVLRKQIIHFGNTLI